MKVMSWPDVLVTVITCGASDVSPTMVPAGGNDAFETVIGFSVCGIEIAKVCAAIICGELESATCTVKK